MTSINKYQKVLNKFNNNYPIIISIPHSGTLMPDYIRNKLADDIVLANTDWFLPKLYDFLIDMGITILINNVSRYVIDVNRKVEKNNTRSFKNNLVFNKNPYNKLIYKHDLSKKDIEHRIKNFYEPYHKELQGLIQNKLKYFKKVYIIDLHSYYLPEEEINKKVIISNQKGKTSSDKTFNIICSSFLKYEVDVLENQVFLGGHISKYYSSKFKTSVECIQIELPYNSYIEDRKFTEEEITYYNEETFKKMKAKLKDIFFCIKERLY